VLPPTQVLGPKRDWTINVVANDGIEPTGSTYELPKDILRQFLRLSPPGYNLGGCLFGPSPPDIDRLTRIR
jgi:hypothetical protein